MPPTATWFTAAWIVRFASAGVFAVPGFASLPSVRTKQTAAHAGGGGSKSCESALTEQGVERADEVVPGTGSSAGLDPECGHVSREARAGIEVVA